MNTIDLKNLSPQELLHLVIQQGWEPYRVRQIMAWLYKRGVSDIDAMTDLSREVRSRLKSIAWVSRLVPAEILTSSDGTKKYLFLLENGWGIETVLIPERNHATLCLSTQLGCALKCRFCYTGSTGLQRNLTAAEILNQIEAVRSDLGDDDHLTNIVFMGMGEPLANYDNTLKALEVIFHTYGFDFSHRRVTVSTSGLVPQLQRLGRESPVNLAVSLNAADEETRSFLMPVNRTYPLASLLKVLSDYPLVHRKRITIEYMLIAGVNDSPQDAQKLVGLLRTVRCKINLIPFNEHSGVSFKRPSQGRIEEFRNILVSHGYTAIIRESKGKDIMAACGQLGGQGSRVKS